MNITRRLIIHSGDTTVIMMISTMVTNYHSWNDDHNDDHGNTHHNVYDENIIHLKNLGSFGGLPHRKATRAGPITWTLPQAVTQLVGFNVYLAKDAIGTG